MNPSQPTPSFLPTMDWIPAPEGDEILPGLFMGGTHDDDVVTLPRDLGGGAPAQRFDAVVTLYALAQPMGWNVEELRYGFGDGDIAQVDLGRVIDAAVWAHRRWSVGHRVLIRCQAGLNRSGLVTALVLMLEGLAAQDAIQLLRTRRSRYALINRSFEGWLLSSASDALRSRRTPSDA